jgi:hypothetical protein
MLCRFVYLLLYINVYNLCEQPLKSITIDTIIPPIGSFTIGSCTAGADIVDLIQQHQEHFHSLFFDYSACYADGFIALHKICFAILAVAEVQNIVKHTIFFGGNIVFCFSG